MGLQRGRLNLEIMMLLSTLNPIDSGNGAFVFSGSVSKWQ